MFFSLCRVLCIHCEPFFPLLFVLHCVLHCLLLFLRFAHSQWLLELHLSFSLVFLSVIGQAFSFFVCQLLLCSLLPRLHVAFQGESLRLILLFSLRSILPGFHVIVLTFFFSLSLTAVLPPLDCLFSPTFISKLSYLLIYTPIRDPSLTCSFLVAAENLLSLFLSVVRKLTLALRSLTATLGPSLQFLLFSPLVIHLLLGCVRCGGRICSCWQFDATRRFRSSAFLARFFKVGG